VSGIVLYVCAVPSMLKGATIANIGVIAPPAGRRCALWAVKPPERPPCAPSERRTEPLNAISCKHCGLVLGTSDPRPSRTRALFYFIPVVSPPANISHFGADQQVVAYKLRLALVSPGL
jgi:hypothetical protein